MTPQLQQAIKLLALSNLELEAFIAEELAKNPLLERQLAGQGARPARPHHRQGRHRDREAAGRLLRHGVSAT
jgi:RNA polymerase sigma-54 factor